MNNIPNLFVIGAPKAGTTALYRRLREHPQVFMSGLKEPHYFSKKTGPHLPSSLSEYLKLFDSASSELMIGEASPSYLHDPDTPMRLYGFNPDCRIVVILRQPVERAYSHHLMMLNSGDAPFGGFEPLFEEACACAKRDEAIPFGSGYKQSWYADALERYYNRFSAEQICVLTHDMLKSNPRPMLYKLFRFLGLTDDVGLPNAGRVVNVGRGSPRSKFVHNLLFADNYVKKLAKKAIPPTLRKQVVRFLIQSNKTDKPKLPNSVKARFTEVFAEDIARTEQLTGLNLRMWVPAELER